MAKVPRPGLVKTRLAGALGAEGACELYRAFIQDFDERLAVLGLPVLWYHWPDDPAFGDLVPGARAVLPQRGADLGERMAGAFADAFERGLSPTVMLGADVPHVPMGQVSDAIGRLQSGAEVVLGPAADGGYYLVGLRAPAPALFRDMPWGSDGVYRETIERSEGHGMRVATLMPWFDIDEVGDLYTLARLLENEPGTRLRRTRAELVRAGIMAEWPRPPSGGARATFREEATMTDWGEDDVAMMEASHATERPRVFDQRMIREPILALNPGPAVTVNSTAALADGLALMKDRRIGCVLVVDDGRVVGILTERDVLLKVAGTECDVRSATVAGFMTADPEVLGPEDSIAFALNKMSVGGFRHVPLVDDARRPVGVVSMRMIVDYLVEFFPSEVLTLPSEPGKNVTRSREGA
jgi:rSAM/selenodomain-associated transferase 1